MSSEERKKRLCRRCPRCNQTLPLRLLRPDLWELHPRPSAVYSFEPRIRAVFAKHYITADRALGESHLPPPGPNVFWLHREFRRCHPIFPFFVCHSEHAYKGERTLVIPFLEGPTDLRALSLNEILDGFHRTIIVMGGSFWAQWDQVVISGPQSLKTLYADAPHYSHAKRFIEDVTEIHLD